MTINLSVPIANPTPELKPRITVIGVGGAGGNAVNNMIRSHLEGVEFVVANTDAQAIAQAIADRRIQLGVTVTQGLGAGSRPDIGRIAAEEALEEIIDELRGSNMVFIAAGMGGGTGTGAAPVIARAAREAGILTVGVVTKPFHFEGAHRMRLAEQGIEELEQFVDTLIIIPNQNLFRVANERTTFADAFKMADDVLYSGVRGVTDLMVMPGLINLDFADIRAVMSEMGKAMMGTGEAEGDRRALDAAEAAISNPLLDDVSMKGARGVLINITGGSDMTLFEVDEAANRVRSEVDPDAFIIFGSTFDDNLQGKVRVSVVATGMDSAAARPATTKLSLVQNNDDDDLASLGGMDDEGEDEAAAMLATGTDDGAPIAREGDAHGGRAGAVQVEAKPAFRAEGYGGDPHIRMEPRRSDDVFGGGSSEGHGAMERMTNLLARVTGAGRSTVRNGRPEESEQGPQPAAAQGTMKPPRFGSVSPEERLPQSKPEDELLDIPAFLRRQAN